MLYRGRFLSSFHLLVFVCVLLVVLVQNAIGRAWCAPPSWSWLLGDVSSSTTTTAITTATVTQQDGHPKVKGRATAPPPPRRGQILTPPIHASQLYHLYKTVQNEYRKKAFGRSTSQWRILTERDGIQVAIMSHPDDPTCPYVRMKAQLPVPAQECWNFLRISKWDQNMPRMDPFYEGVSVHGEFWYHQVHIQLCRKRMRRILAFGKRDLTFLSVSDHPLPDGTLVSGTISVETPLLPRQHGYTRAFQDSIAFYKPINNNTQTDLTIICRIDLNDSATDGMGGYIPMWFVHSPVLGHN